MTRHSLRVPHDEEGCRQRFRAAMTGLGLPRHPNILAPHDHGEAASFLYLVTDDVPGGLIHARLPEAWPLAEALELARQVAHALAHAHKRGVVYDSLSPNNVLFDHDGTPLVVGFSLAPIMLPPGMPPALVPH